MRKPAGQTLEKFSSERRCIDETPRWPCGGMASGSRGGRTACAIDAGSWVVYMPPKRSKNHARRRLVVDLDARQWHLDLWNMCLWARLRPLLLFLYPVSAENWAKIAALVCGYGLLLCTYNLGALCVYYVQVLGQNQTGALTIAPLDRRFQAR